jgi:predicted transcriptional regulator
MLEQYLRDIGLSDKEAAVYLALLETDYASPLELSRKINIKRATAYVVLESLMKKGLVSETKAGKKTRYQAAPPERLQTFIGHQQVALQEKAKLLGEMIPQFRSIQKESGTRPVVKYVEGREGVLISYEESHGRAGERGVLKYSIYSRDLVDSFFTAKEQRQIRAGRLEHGVKNRSVYTCSKGDLPRNPTIERVRIDAKKYPLPCDINIARDEVWFNSLSHSVSSLYVKSHDIATTLKSVIEYVLEIARNKKVEKEPEG